MEMFKRGDLVLVDDVALFRDFDHTDMGIVHGFVDDDPVWGIDCVKVYWFKNEEMLNVPRESIKKLRLES